MHDREIKFVVDHTIGGDLREWARVNLEPDPHGTGPFGDQYTTTTVCFDTLALDAWHERGSFGRAKYRTRRYGDADTVFVERKLRLPPLVIKRRTGVPLADLPRLDEPGVDAWPAAWFGRRLATRGLAPVCRVWYRRTARQAFVDGTRVRLTLDEDVFAVSTTDVVFDKGPGVPLLRGSMILELKYETHIPAVFRRLMEDCGLVPGRVSKYRLSMVALGRAVVEPRQEDVFGAEASVANTFAGRPEGKVSV